MTIARPAPGFLQLIDGLDDEEEARLFRALGRDEAWGADRDWASWAHDGQAPPPPCGDGALWSTWVIMAGRGFGKTLAGAHWIAGLVAEAAAAGREPPSIALVGATLDEARRVMVEGRSGILTVADAWVRDWNPSLRRIGFTTGAQATLFSGASPEQLRGPEHHIAWCDELAKWEKPQESWDMLQLGLRLGDAPRVLVTTTPRPGPVLGAIMAAPGCVVTGGPSRANPHVSPAWQRAMADRYAGTRLGRQELNGELLTDTPGALWTVELLERCRSILPGTGRGTAAGGGGGGGREARAGSTESRPDEQPPPPACGWSPSPSRGGFSHPIFTRIVIGVDPPARDGTCGIIACARDAEGRAHVLADHSVAARTPEGWASAVADAARIWSLNPPRDGEGDRSSKANGGGGYGPAVDGGSPLPVTIVAEQNQGGKMVAAVLRTADPDLRVKSVTATVGKSERAAPVAMLFEAGKVVLHGRFPELEAEMCGMIAGGGYEPAWSGGPGGPGASPDRADAMVWGLTELMLGKERVAPRVRGL